jgi:hypothetical protein
VSSAPAPLIVFQVGPRVFATDASDVERIGPVQGGADGVVAESCLGTALAAQRELVVRGATATLAVDLVLGIREPAPGELCEVPALAAACLGSRAVRGLVLLDGIPTPIIDLPTLVREQRPGPAPDPGESHHA